MGWTLDMMAAARTEKTHLHELLLPTLPVWSEEVDE
jgi:hypothetical protein